MNKIKIIFLASVGAILVGCSSQAPRQHFPSSTENDCMVNAFNQLATARKNTREQSNQSKESQCFWSAESRYLYSSIANSPNNRGRQNAAGNIVIQQSINIDNNNPQAIKDRYFNECMQDPNIKAFTAPPAYSQIEGMLFGFRSINVDACPAAFQDHMGKFIWSTENVVSVLRMYPHLNTANQNSIIRKQVPSNNMEKDIIDSHNYSVSNFKEMVRFFARETGWCPGDNGLYKCNAESIRFNN